MGRRNLGETRFDPVTAMKSNSYWLDTSIVLRLLTRDPLPLFQSASAFVRKWRKGRPELFVPDLVLAESYYALQHHYGFSKADALSALLALSRHPAIAVSPHAQTILAQPRLASANPGFVDQLIHGAAQASNGRLVTFEKSARKLADTLVLD